MIPNIGKKARYLFFDDASFFDGSEQCFAWIIEAEQMSVLGEKLADGYFLLGLCHILCGGTAFADFRHTVILSQERNCARAETATSPAFVCNFTIAALLPIGHQVAS